MHIFVANINFLFTGGSSTFVIVDNRFFLNSFFSKLIDLSINGPVNVPCCYGDLCVRSSVAGLYCFD